MTLVPPNEPRTRIDNRIRPHIRAKTLKSYRRVEVVVNGGGLGVVADEADVEVEVLADVDVFLVGAEDVDGEDGELAGGEDGFGFGFET